MWLLLNVSIIFAVIFNASGDSDSKMPEMNFEVHFNHLSDKRHPFYMDGGPWLHGRKYIQGVFRRYGCRDQRDQYFNTTVSGKTVEGVNIICVVEGLNKTAPLIVVGADYATSKVANQLKDNTGGVASLLEVMHIFFDRIYWNNYNLDKTVIFVAFDLNTREYHDSALGHPGSYSFLHEWLLPYLNRHSKDNKKELLGAIILDSITIFNTANNTQFLANGFDKAMPEAYNKIEESGRKGDFLGLLYTSRDKDNPVISTFSSRWNKDKKRRPFRLQEMKTTLSFDSLADDVIRRIDHQAHYHFWTYFEDTLPAFLLFDTDEDRTESAPCHVVNNCTVEEFLTKDKTDFLSKTTDTVLNTILDLQTTYYKSDCVSNSPMAVLVAVLLIGLLSIKSATI